MTTPAVWITPPTTKMQEARSIVPRRPRGSEKDARNAPQKQPAVKSATTVPDLASADFCRNNALKESDATTSAITPLQKLALPERWEPLRSHTDHIRTRKILKLQSNLEEIDKFQAS